MKKSPNDHKHYQPLTLPNGLRVLLVHNNSTKKSAAALAVNVGHFSDPEHRQGLAHFLEHMLFLGTTGYPDGSEYQKFINQHGGSNNAWTATEHTCYFLDINHQFFEEALNRFSQFFTCPLLSPESIASERENIDAEFKLKLKDDIRRLYDVHKETINPEHPFSKFSVGNNDTLKDTESCNIHEEIKAMEFDIHQVQKKDEINKKIFSIRSVYKENKMNSKYFFGIQSANILQIYFDTREEYSSMLKNKKIIIANLNECKANI